jgi:hypothetical protein
MELVVTKVKVLELEFTSSKLSNVLIIENCFDLGEIKNFVMPFGDQRFVHTQSQYIDREK